MLTIRTSKTEQALEEYFLDHYAWLMRWSLRFTANDQDGAEDLVHDLYVRLVQLQPQLQSVGNIKSYLYTTLRNLHISRCKRRQMLQVEALSLVDYDSVLVGLQAQDGRHFVSLRSDLRRICEYACQRRATLKGASILLLRFFFDFLPSEIAKLANMSRAAVDEALRVARAEAKMLLSRPKSLRFPAQNISLYFSDQPSPERTEDLLSELRRGILNAAQGACGSIADWTEIYSCEENPLSTERLAHLSGCFDCLQAVCRLLGLAFPGDSTHGGNSTAGSSSSSGSGSDFKINGREAPGDRRGRALKGAKAYLARMQQHCPRELKIAVNGRIRASQKITSRVNEFHIPLTLQVRIQFIEVISEQGLCLLYAPILAPHESADGEQVFEVEFDSSHSLRLVYSVTGLEQRIHLLYLDDSLAARVPEKAEAEVIGDSALRSAVAREPGPLLETLRGLTRKACHWIGIGIGIANSIPRPFAIACALFLLSVGILLTGKQRVERQLEEQSETAAVLNRLAGQFAAIPGGTYLHATYRIELVQKDRSLQLGSLDSWTAAGGKRVDRRWLDARGAVLAERRMQPDGEVIEHGLQAASSLASDASAENLWSFNPDPSDFDQQISRANRQQELSRADSGYVISMRRKDRADGIASARIILASDGKSIAAEELLVRKAGVERRYRLVRTLYEIVPASQVPDDLSLRSRFGKDPHPLVSPVRGHSNGLKGAALELHALYLLSRVGLDMQDQVRLMRMPDGTLRIGAYLESAEPLAAVQGVIRELGGNSRLELLSTGPRFTKDGRTRPTGLRVLKSSQELIPADALIRRSLSRRALRPQEEDSLVQQIASAVIGDSQQMRQHAWALAFLTQEFSPEDLRSMSPARQHEWSAMLLLHASAIQERSSAIRERFYGIVPLGEASPLETSPTLTDPLVVAAATKGLLAHVELLNRAIGAQFSLSPDPGPPQDIATPGFKLLFAETESLATDLAKLALTLESSASAHLQP